jgi:hypothetical protein
MIYGCQSISEKHQSVTREKNPTAQSFSQRNLGEHTHQALSSASHFAK